MSSQAFAKNYQLKCTATFNSQTILEKEITLPDSGKTLSIGTEEGFEYLLTSKVGNVIELQVLDREEQFRMYASAKFPSVNSLVELSIWRRDYLMEARCTSL